MNKPRILIIENSIHVTGSLKAVLRTSQALQSAYHFVFVLPKGSNAVSLVQSLGFNVYEVPMTELSRRAKSFLVYIPHLVRSVRAIKRITREEAIDLVHVNDFYNMIMPAWKLVGGRTNYLNHINFVPGVFPALLRSVWITSHRIFSRKIIAVSNHVLRQLPHDKKVIYIPNTLPDTGEHPETLINLSREKVFLFIGNFIVGKGQDMALRAFADLKQERYSWKLRFVGGDMGMEKNRLYKKSLEELAVALGVQEAIEWVDFTAHVEHEYKTAGVALNFSLSESYSLTVQEAMFYGCPVIATNSGGPGELIDQGHSGILVPVNDVAAMTQAMKQCIQDDSLRLTLAKNAALSVREKYGKAKTIDLLRNVYDSILHNK